MIEIDVLCSPSAYPHDSIRFQNQLDFCFRCIHCIGVEGHRFDPALVHWQDVPGCSLQRTNFSTRIP